MGSEQTDALYGKVNSQSKPVVTGARFPAVDELWGSAVAAAGALVVSVQQHAGTPLGRIVHGLLSTHIPISSCPFA
jgi:hypothetical protein